MSNPSAIIIEDDHELAELYSHSLKLVNYETLVINDGQHALKHLNQAAPPSIIVLDLHLPRVSGDQILAHLKADPKFNKSQIIITTADSILAKTLKGQNEYVLIKPVSLLLLRDLAGKLLPKLNENSNK